MRTDGLDTLAARLQELADRAESQRDAAYEESDYESGNYERGVFYAYTYAAAQVREVANAAEPPPTPVYVLLRTDSYDRSWVVGVYVSEDAAKAAADRDDQQQRSATILGARDRKPLTWDPEFDRGRFAQGLYSYTVEEHDVQR